MLHKITIVTSVSLLQRWWNFKTFNKTQKHTRNFLQVFKYQFHKLPCCYWKIEIQRIEIGNEQFRSRLHVQRETFRVISGPICDQSPQNVPDGSLIDSLNSSSPKNRRRFVFGRELLLFFWPTSPRKFVASAQEWLPSFARWTIFARVDVILFRGRHSTRHVYEPILLVSAIKFANCETCRRRVRRTGREWTRNTSSFETVLFLKWMMLESGQTRCY